MRAGIEGAALPGDLEKLARFTSCFRLAVNPIPFLAGSGSTDATRTTCGGLSTAKLVIRYAGSALPVP
jgi:hypothetical protein